MIKIKSRYPRITDDLVFGHIMSNKKNCLELLQRIFPELHLTKVNVISQYDGNIGLEAKNIRLDVWAQNDQGRVYDIEMQTTRKNDLEERMMYYAMNLNRFTLKTGQSYDQLKSSYVVFLCTFDPYDQGKSVYDFGYFDKRTKKIEFKTGTHVKVFNSKGNNHDLNQKMVDFLDYMNGIINHPEGYIASLQKNVDHYVNSGKWVDDMDKLEYEMDQVAKKAAEEAAKKAKMEDAKKLVLTVKRMGGTKNTASQELTTNYGEVLSSQEIEQLIEENY